MNTIIRCRKKKNGNYKPKNLFIKGYNYNEWLENVELSDKEESVDLSDMPPLEPDEEEVREGKGLKTSTPNTLLTRLPILLAQIKAGNNSNKLKNKVRQIVYLLSQHNKIPKKVYNNLIKSL